MERGIDLLAAKPRDALFVCSEILYWKDGGRGEGKRPFSLSLSSHNGKNWRERERKDERNIYPRKAAASCIAVLYVVVVVIALPSSLSQSG